MEGNFEDGMLRKIEIDTSLPYGEALGDGCEFRQQLTISLDGTAHIQRCGYVDNNKVFLEDRTFTMLGDDAESLFSSFEECEFPEAEYPLDISGGIYDVKLTDTDGSSATTKVYPIVFVKKREFPIYGFLTGTVIVLRI